MDSKENARETIYAQDALLSVKRSAWVLYQHQLMQINPRTKKHYTHRKALSNVLRWMALLKKRGNMSQIQLTPTQKKILRLLVMEGLTRKEIALRLARKPVTIDWHMKQIINRLGVNSTYQVIALAVEYGLVGVPTPQQ